MAQHQWQRQPGAKQLDVSALAQVSGPFRSDQQLVLARQTPQNACNTVVGTVLCGESKATPTPHQWRHNHDYLAVSS